MNLLAPAWVTAGLWASRRASGAGLAQTLLTPAERAERAGKARATLNEWNGYAPTPAEQDDLDHELDRRLAQVAGR
ncbi:hypothetical protein ACFUIV_31205 [Streptomyces anulatus]|uniref:hypothetical protein n=1 Tax=Streptomyces anulatus TaxID=1892 RepID=UPI00363A6308